MQLPRYPVGSHLIEEIGHSVVLTKRIMTLGLKIGELAQMWNCILVQTYLSGSFFLLLRECGLQFLFFYQVLKDSGLLLFNL